MRYAPAVIAFVAIVVGGLFAGNLNRSLYQIEHREQVQSDLQLVRSKLEGAIRSDIQLVRGFVATLRTEPYMSTQRYGMLVSQLFQEKTRLRNIAGAPDFVIKYMYPMKGNAKALGFDYRTKPVQLESVERARDTRSLVFTGPVDLVQGGRGFIVRFPVYIPAAGGTDRFWGVLSAVIDVDALYRDVGLGNLSIDYDIAIRETNEEGQAGRQFYGNGATFEPEANAEILDVSMPMGSWQLAGVPVGGWQTTPPNAFFLRFVFAGAIFFAVTPMIFAGWLIGDRHRSYRQLARRESELTRLSRRLNLALGASKIGVWEFDMNQQKLVWDERVGQLYGRPHTGIVERDFADWRDSVHPDDLERAVRESDEAVASGASYSSDYRVVLPDGEIRHLRTRAMSFQDAGGNMLVGAEWDVTDDMLLRQDLERARNLAELRNVELEKASSRIRHNALHDALTGLPNRRYLDDRLGSLSDQEPRGLLHIDLDRFKQINDTLGHAAGDAMLTHAASVLQSCVRDGDFIARIGGDEFVVLCTKSVSPIMLSQVAGRIIQRMREPVPYKGRQCRFGVSIGIAVDMDCTVEPRDLFVNADIALYRAKDSGRDRFEFFTEALQSEIHNNKRIADEILDAIERNEFFPYYQPQMCARTLQIAGVEALARWRHPTRGVLTPAEFLHVAEDLNVVATIDRMILEQALADFRSWGDQGLAIPRISVNVSARRIREGGLIEGLIDMDIPPGALAFELVESIFLDEQDETLSWNVDRIKEMGIEIEIDDFGTGYASIIGLQKLKPARLKIDRQLTVPVVESEAQRKMLSSIIEIGKSLGIDIVAEGVETMSHAMILQSIGCDLLQGYALGRPMTAEAMAEFAKKDRAPLTA